MRRIGDEAGCRLAEDDSPGTVRFWQGEYDVTTLRSVPSWA